MKHRQIAAYSDNLVEAVRSFCSNPRVLNAAIRISFSKTSRFDSAAVYKTMQNSAKWFLKLQHKKMDIPSDFDWAFFMKGVNMLLTLDHGTSTASIIWLLYQIMHVIPEDIKEVLLGNLLTPETFFRFFFHWSWNVRRSFYYLFYF